MNTLDILKVAPEELHQRLHERMVKFVDKPTKVPDGRVLVLRRRPAERPVDDVFWIEEITPQ